VPLSPVDQVTRLITRKGAVEDVPSVSTNMPEIPDEVLPLEPPASEMKPPTPACVTLVVLPVDDETSVWITLTT